MLRSSVAALLISTALTTGGALAQTSSAPSTSGSASSGTAGAASGQFMTEQVMGQFRASKFVGLNIYGADNERIGDINEILIDASGNAKAVVIGVGGFLGIGEKNVAVPFSAVQWVNTPMRSAAAGGGTGATSGATGGTSGGSAATGGGTGSAGASGAGIAPSTGSNIPGAGANMSGSAASTTGPAGTTGGAAPTTAAGGGTGTTAGTGPGNMATTGGTAATMGSTTAGSGSATTAGNMTGTAASRPAGASATTQQRSPDEMASYNGYPDHGVVRMSKADLQNAPTFRYYSQVNSASGAASNATTSPMTGPAGTPRQ